jgi:hypothetical protein
MYKPRQRLNIIGLYLGFFMLLLCGLFLLATTALMWLDQSNLERNGLVAQGTVENTYVTKGKSTSYKISYQYAVLGSGGATGYCSTTQEVSEEGYNRLVKGTPVTVKYLPENRCHSLLEDPSREDYFLRLVVISSILLIAAGVVRHELRSRQKRLRYGY